MKLGVVGCGHLGSIHARVYTEIPGVELCGVHDVDPAKSAAIAEKLGCESHESLASLAAAADALSVCVPTTEHCVRRISLCTPPASRLRRGRPG